MSNQTNVKTEPGQFEIDESKKTAFRGNVFISPKRGIWIAAMYNWFVEDQNDRVLPDGGSGDPANGGHRRIGKPVLHRINRMKINGMTLCSWGLCMLYPLLASALDDDYPWGRIELKPKSAEFHIKNAEHHTQLEVPRFQNPVTKLFLKSDPQQQPLRLKPGVTTWQITLPDHVQGSAVIVMQTVGPPRLTREPVIYRPDAQGEVVLPAHGAIVHGEKLRYEPQPHKNTVGYWQNEKDWCEWKLSLPKPMSYHVYILQGCGKGHGGSRVNVIAGDRQLEFEVEDTGHFQNFLERQIGTLEFGSSKNQSIKLVPVNKAKGAVMDVRQVRLVPVKGKE